MELAVQETKQNVLWRSSIEEAHDEARLEGKLVLIYLWHHSCGGSKTMEAETYPENGVRAYIERRFVPIRFNVLEQPEIAQRYNSGWTPMIIVENAAGREHRR